MDDSDWREISELMLEYLPQQKEKEELKELEKHGARLMASPDQKRMRPGVGLKFAQARDLDVPREALIKAMTALEGIHFYSKGIDDIQDKDEERNGFPTLHEHISNYFQEKGVGEEKADELGENLAHDYFLAVKSRNYCLVSSIEEDNLPEDVRVDDIRIEMEKAENGLTDGQNLDLSGTAIGYGDFKPDYLGGDKEVQSHIFDGNRGKTAELFSSIGREIEMLSEDYEGDELENWGYNAGQAFQIWDDVLDLKSGRNSDMEENNYVFPTYVAERFLHTHPDEEKNELGEELSRILRDPEVTENELERANYIVTEETPAVEASRNQAKYLVDQANDYLDDVDWDNPRAVEEVKALTEKLGYRRGK